MSDAFKGEEELLLKLAQMDSSIRNEIVRKAVLKGAEFIRREAVLLCPVDSGELRNSIMCMVEQNNHETVGTVYTNKEYAPYVEFGTGPVGAANHFGISPEATPTYRQSGWGYYDDKNESWLYTNGQPARPFMYPALKNNEEKATEMIQKDIIKYLKEVTG